MRTMVLTTSVVFAALLGLALTLTTTGCCSTDPADGMPCACEPGEPGC